jgi:hypothetical protein
MTWVSRPTTLPLATTFALPFGPAISSHLAARHVAYSAGTPSASLCAACGGEA